MTTKQALESSIIKWRDIAFRDGEDRHGYNCGLCIKFVNEKPCCSICPVRLKTGYKSCKGSPYEEWENHYFEAHEDETDDDGEYYEYPIVHCYECKILAVKELLFLRSLRKEIK